MNEDNPENLQLEGRNAVLEALRGGRAIDKLMVKTGEKEGSIRQLIAKAREAGIVVSESPKERLDALSKTGRHQGVIAFCAAHEYGTVEDMLELAKSRGQEPFIIMLDGVADPRNLGAIIRSAEAAGAHGCIVPKRRSAGITELTVKASAGAVEYLPVARVGNLVHTIEDLKKRGIWVCGAAMDGQSLYDAPLEGPVALVVGGEGGGLGRLITEKCDFTVAIPMKGRITSLNASVAAAVIMYEIARRRGG
ncbi:MAG: 23S rRNA (guanosine(2251)-2'-O)-methyltransferase RlmB [Clostridiales bacterium]|jgi:23S rRNA (guanosine2251-2'-O)-methyltransferase|nr:23S rRNA (guanosine(2251)-2'-O)-methyltransferase RlmB [Clostridiales bacterium]